MALRPDVPPTEYMNNFNSGLMLDDQIWVETLRRERLLQEENNQWSSPSEDMLFHLMRTGSASDDSRFDQPGYTLTRAQRYSAALSFRLWKLLQNEKRKVSVPSKIFEEVLTEHSSADC